MVMSASIGTRPDADGTNAGSATKALIAHPNTVRMLQQLPHQKMHIRTSQAPAMFVAI